MTVDEGAMRSRRALLGTALGVGAATIAGAFVRPELVRAGSDGDVVLGDHNDATSTTFINETSATGPGLRVDSRHGAGIVAACEAGPGVIGLSPDGSLMPGVEGIGYYQSPAVVGFSELGSFGTPTPTEFPPKTGVYGATSCLLDTGERGVYGKATRGQGVRGEATDGIGVYATATTGTALRVDGKASFKRAGKATIRAGHRSVDVTVVGGLGGAPLCFANLASYRAGVSVAAVRPNYPSAGKIRIYVTRTMTANTTVAWMVIN
jgi:hypothetical protein